MDLELEDRRILCIAESHFSSISALRNFFDRLDESSTLFILSSNRIFFDRIIELSELYNIDLIIKHPNYEDIDESNLFNRHPSCLFYKRVYLFSSSKFFISCLSFSSSSFLLIASIKQS